MAVSIFLERNSGMPEETEQKNKKKRVKNTKKIKPTPLQSCRTLQLQSEHNIALHIQIYIHYNSMADC